MQILLLEPGKSPKMMYKGKPKLAPKDALARKGLQSIAMDIARARVEKEAAWQNRSHNQ